MDENTLIGDSKSAVDILGRQWTYECIGCSLGNYDMDPPGGIIYEDDLFIAHQDPEIPIKGFIVLTCKKHFNSINQLDDEQRMKLIELTNKVILYLKELKITEQVTIVQEERSKHLHIWIFPYHSWMDEKFGKGVSYLRDICKYAQQNSTKKEISEILNIVNELKKLLN